ncbi:signal peptidase II [Pseudoflavonifractor sp.]|jgi:signal peptidase II|uniref:signal peptidase II n=1 Tax=Pseudoflavonifractor sp. TaxID=1980281 RepID=UPI003D8E3C3D
MPYAILAVVLVIADQVVKFLIRSNLELGESVPFIPHVLNLTYYQNTGAAFSLFREHTWILALISAVVSVALVVVMVKRVFRHPVGQVILAVILAGAVGNLIDRVLFGYVTDMFQTIFINFAVFNVADCCLVCGVIAMMVYVLFFHEKLEKAPAGQEAGHDAADPEG